MTTDIILKDTPPSSKVTKGKLKTSGQIEPEFSLLGSYGQFPKRIEGPTVWKAEDYRGHPERWTHVWSDGELEEIELAADRFLSEEYELTEIKKELFQLPKVASFPESVRNELINGKGFILFKGFPVQRWGNKNLQ